MFVRVYDKLEKRYYKSIVYGVINTGYYEQVIVLNPYINSFELINHFDQKAEKAYPLYESINSSTNEWVTYEKTFLLKLKMFCKENISNCDISVFRGYKEVFDDFEFLLNILKNKKVAVDESTIELKEYEDINEWNYIRNKEDINEFMKLFVGFHDSTLDKLVYEEDYGKNQIKLCFDNSGWYGVVELCFEGVIALNLRAPLENYSREIYSASLFIKDESIFWADEELEDEDLSYIGTYVKALNLKWRKIK